MRQYHFPSLAIFQGISFFFQFIFDFSRKWCDAFSKERNVQIYRHSKKKNHSQNLWKLKYSLISQVDPVHPVAHVQMNSLTGGVGDNTDDTFALLLNKTLLDSLVGRTLTGLPIELIPRIPRRTTTAVVCSSVLSPSFRPLLSYFVGFYNKFPKKKKT